MRRAVRSRLGSALRLSQPLSGFLAHPSFVALFRATTVPGIPPSEFFPSQRSRTPLEAAGSLAVIHRRAVARWTSPFADRFPDFHAFTRSPGSSVDYGLPFRSPKLAFRSSWVWLSGLAPFRQLHLLRSFLPPARPYQQLWVAPLLLAVTLLGFGPPKLSPSTPWILDPPRPRGPEHAPSSEDSGARHEGPRPLLPGETFLSTFSTQVDLVDGFQPP
jgi:hypothetical protein